ncbi:MAG: orotidine 5'-phosphate decarboxylase / HUMPS family protein, partial [Acidimicrobiales bacterium]
AAPGLVRAVPGIRVEQFPGDDQRRTGTPEDAIAAGADLLVVGRPVTRALDPAAASRQVAAAVGRAG